METYSSSYLLRSQFEQPASVTKVYTQCRGVCSMNALRMFHAQCSHSLTKLKAIFSHLHWIHIFCCYVTVIIVSSVSHLWCRIRDKIKLKLTQLTDVIFDVVFKDLLKTPPSMNVTSRQPETVSALSLHWERAFLFHSQLSLSMWATLCNNRNSPFQKRLSNILCI